MPELPEVETMRRGILRIVGSRISAIEVLRCSRRPITIQPAIQRFRKRAVGQKVVSVDRFGKRVAIRLQNDDRIIFEPRMTGLVLVADPPSEEHLRLRVDFVDGPLHHVWYWDRRGLGNIRLLTAAELSEQLGQGTLGPDALSVSPLEFRERLCNSHREIKVALLDQRSIAGIGNLYAAEILHLAGVHPRVRCNRLKIVEWDGIHSAMNTVLQAAIRHEGSTLSDGTYRNALNQAGGYQNHHRVYDRAGEVCLTCRIGSIERIVQAQRSTFYCRQCQRRR
jgi:formamidopyrimidine-DNA glycosylase